MDVVQAAIPLFFALIGLELLVARLRGRRVYRLDDSISDLSCGILSQFAGIAIALLTIGVFGWVSQHWALPQRLGFPGWIARSPFPRPPGQFLPGVDPSALASWTGVFLLDDLAYYWMHRASHVVHLLWAGHVVHHSSEEFNLTVALRQSSLHGLMSWVFYLPLAFLGVPVTMWVVCHGLNLIYQFWIHTREINRLGVLEKVLNTPSHHRVHHGVNPEYQDRNFAGTFIVWDRLFGSFEPERAEPVYGITRPLRSWSPIRANVHVFADIAGNFRFAATWPERWRTLFGHPRWKPARRSEPADQPDARGPTGAPLEAPAPRALKAYALAQFVVVLVGSVALLNAAPRLDSASLAMGIFAVVASLGNIAGLLEARRWTLVAEPARLVAAGAAAGLALAAGMESPPLLLAAMLFAAFSLFWMLRLRPYLTSRDQRAAIVM